MGYVTSEGWLSWVSTTFCINFVFLLSLLNLVPSSIYSCSLGRLCVAFFCPVRTECLKSYCLSMLPRNVDCLFLILNVNFHFIFIISDSYLLLIFPVPDIHGIFLQIHISVASSIFLICEVFV